MTNFPRMFCAAFLLLSGLLRAEPVTPEQRARIEAAVPSTAPARPAQARKLLVYSQTKGYRHASIEAGVAAITLMGARTGAYTATASEDPAALTAESLRGYDAVLFLNVTGDIFATVESQQALLDFVRGGGGVAGIHSATDACYEWPEWGEMLGGWFDGHPWTANSHVTVWIEEPGHPLNAAFGGASSLAIQDEIYQLKGPDFRANHRVLSSLDPRRTDMTLAGIKREDRDFPITQIREYGKGRVFYCALGHNQHIYWNPAVLGHYLAGLQWVMGDLAADAAPRPRGALPPLVADPAFWSQLKATGYAEDPRILDRLDTALAEAGQDPAKRAELEQRLADFFADPATTPAALQAAGQRLGLVLAANPAAKMNATLVLLGRALRDDARVDAARLALDPAPGAAVDAIFVEALGQTSGRTRLGLIQSAGTRRIAAAVPAIARLLADPDAATAQAAAWALGRIGGNAALRALDGAPDTLAVSVVDARLALAAGATPRVAGRIYESIYENSGFPDPQRATALRGLIAARPGAALKHIQQTLSGNVTPFQQVALEAVATLADQDTVRKLSQQLAVWSPDVQFAVIGAFGRRGEPAAVPALLAMLGNQDESIRLATIDALGRIPGSRETAQRLAAIAQQDGDEAKAAAAALARLDGRGLDEFVLENARQGEAALRVVYLRQLALRGQVESVPMLLGLRSEADADIRQAALESLGDLATAAEVGALLDWARQATEAGEQNRAVRSLISVLLRDDAVETRAEPVLAAIRGGDAKMRLALLPVLPRVAGAPALATLQELALDADAAVAGAAVSNLARWPDNAAVGALVNVAERTGDAAVRAAAVASAARFLEKERDAKDLDETALLGRLLALPGEAESQKNLLRLLSRGADEPAQAIAERFTAQAEVAEAARDAVDAIRANRDWPPVVAASAAEGDRAKVADGRMNTNWAVPAKPGAWLQVDLKHSRPVRKLILEPARGGDFPEELQVYVSEDPAAWGEARATFTGSNGRSVIELPDGVRGRHVRLVHTGSRDEGNWSVAELVVE